MMGFKIIKHIIKDDPNFEYEYRSNIVPVVSFGKSDKWKKHILKVGSEAGYEVLRGISRKFGLQPDVVDAGTPEIYQRKKTNESTINENKLHSSYFHRRIFNNEK